MKLLKNNIFVLKNSYIEIVPIADIHYGAWGHNERLFRRQINYIKNNKYCYGVGVGDWVDMVTMHSKGLPAEQKLKATEQTSGIVDLLEPIAHKLLFALTGNHDSRASRIGAPDAMYHICRELDIEYRGIDCHFAIRLPKGTIYCYAGHNSGGGGTAGSKINRLHALHNQAPNADLILSAHTHSITSDVKPLNILTPYGKLTTKMQYLISCGSMLESTEGYAKAAFYAPQATCFKILKISVKRGSDGEDRVRLIESVVMDDNI